MKNTILIKQFAEYIDVIQSLESERYKSLEDIIIESAYVFLSKKDRFFIGLKIMFSTFKKN